MPVSFLAPTKLNTALSALAEGPWSIVAGGTDFFPAHVGRPLPERILNISRIQELRGIHVDGRSIRIGALTTWADIRNTPLPGALDGLRKAAGKVGAEQVQNTGTLGGNLCNASPAADGVPPLLTLEANVELTSDAGRRTLPLSVFLQGYRRTAIQPRELLTSITVDAPHDGCHAGFLKLGSRKHLVISIVMAASLLRLDGGGTILDARLAIGACSPVAQRLTSLERSLVGSSIRHASMPSVFVDQFGTLEPIDDIRGSAAYRLEACRHLIRQLLTEARRAHESAV